MTQRIVDEQSLAVDVITGASITSRAVLRGAEEALKDSGLDLDALGRDVFSASSANKPADVLLKSDFKEFNLGDHRLGISQITTMDSESMLKRKDEFLAEMHKIKKDRQYDLVLLMVTDVLREGTQLLFEGDKETIHQAFNLGEIVDDTVFLPGIVSRKKQMVPALSALWG